MVPSLFRTSSYAQYDARDFGASEEPEAEEDFSKMDRSVESVTRLALELKFAIRSANEARDKLDALHEENDRYFSMCQKLKQELKQKDEDMETIRRNFEIEKSQLSETFRREVQNVHQKVSISAHQVVERMHRCWTESVVRLTGKIWIASARKTRLSRFSREHASFHISKTLGKVLGRYIDILRPPVISERSLIRYPGFSRTRAETTDAACGDIPAVKRIESSQVVFSPPERSDEDTEITPRKLTLCCYYSPQDYVSAPPVRPATSHSPIISQSSPSSRSSEPDRPLTADACVQSSAVIERGPSESRILESKMVMEFVNRENERLKKTIFQKDKRIKELESRDAKQRSLLVYINNYFHKMWRDQLTSLRSRSWSPRKSVRRANFF